jgi:hypothetical protein
MADEHITFFCRYFIKYEPNREMPQIIVIEFNEIHIFCSSTRFLGDDHSFFDKMKFTDADQIKSVIYFF